MGDFIEEPEQLSVDIEGLVVLLQSLGVLFQVQFLQTVGVLQNVALHLFLWDRLLVQSVSRDLHGQGVTLGVDASQVETGVFLVPEAQEGDTVGPFPG